MPVQFRARVASVRINPSRSEDATTVTRILLEAHDIEVDQLRLLLDRDVFVVLTQAETRQTPIEAAIAASTPNGQEPTPMPTAGRRRGTRATPTDGE